MFILSPDAAPVVVYSPTDLARAECPYLLLRELDAKLGRLPALEPPEDPMRLRAAQLGDEHEARVLAEYVEEYGEYDGVARRGVAVIASGEGTREQFRATLDPAREETLAALHGGADVVFQGSFFDGRFHGRADFLVKVPGTDPGPGAGAQQYPCYAVVDTKLTAKVRSSALLQLAGYADQLLASGVPVDEHVWIHHGDGVRSGHLLGDLLEVYRGERRLVEALLEAHVALGRAVSWDEWRDPFGSPAELDLLAEGVALSRRACGRCDACTPEVERTWDVRLVHGISRLQRTRCYRAGVRTVPELARVRHPLARVNPAVQARLVRQAGMQTGQLEREAEVVRAGLVVGPGMRVEQPDGERADPALAARFEPIVRSAVVTPAVLAALPPTSPGDIYFDFEGDPLWTEHGALDGGIEYLFGLVEEGEEERYVAFWAHDRAQEKRALEDFLGYLLLRRQRYPDMHVYHFAGYEKSALERLAERHGTGLEEVLELIREGVLVDLFPVVRSGVVVSSPSYSIKKLEPLYMGEELRDPGGVTSGGASVAEYARATRLRSAGEDAAADAVLAELADYNRYDCVSTRRLAQWLRSLVPADSRRPIRRGTDAEDRPVPSAGEVDPEDLAAVLAPTGRRRLEIALARAAGPQPRSDDAEAVALVAATLDYHRREDAPAWRAHFERLTFPLDWWAETRDVLCVGEGPAAVELVSDWTASHGTRVRVLRLTGSLGPGSAPRVEEDVLCLYPAAGARGLRAEPHAMYATTRARLQSVSVSPDGTAAVLQIRETAPESFAEGDGAAAVPVAVVPGTPIPSRNQQAVLLRVAESVAGTTAGALSLLPPGSETPAVVPTLRPGPGLDLLRRLPPRLRRTSGRHAAPESASQAQSQSQSPAQPQPQPQSQSQSPSPSPALPEVLDHDVVTAVTRATAALDDSYLAVQGPPGSGKTYLGARVIAALVQELGWRVGVVAQSHAVIEHLLDEVVTGAGLAPELVAKHRRPVRGEVRPGERAPLRADAGWRVLDRDEHSDFLRDHGSGCVLGGTAWDFTNRNRVAAGELDLLVVDEAGQFSLANTVAVATAARRLLLLGDPQQLPQVSQGSHAEPVDTSALAWIARGHAVLPATHGYFVDRTWRMHSALCAAVSALSYDGRLAPQRARTDSRHLTGLAPGVHVRTVAHRGNSSASREEAVEVLRLVSGLMGRPWVPGAEQPARPMDQDDVIVVAPFNAQVTLVREELDAAGLTRVRVGTVDKFQGQEAAVSVLTLASSSAQDVPRGLTFLLNRNRLNVAISRGQWAAVVVRSESLTDSVPHDGDALADLGAFQRLCVGAVGAS